MSDFLYVPLKKGWDVDIIKPLKNVLSIINSTSKEPKDYTDQVIQLNKLRRRALMKKQAKDEESLVELYFYYDQLNSLEKKIPVGELQIPFKWRDAFSKGLLTTTKSTLTISSVGYEKSCILFNIAALQSYIGSVQGTECDECLKLAAKMFQLSAGIFDHLKRNIMSILHQEPSITLDLHPSTLNYFSCLMIAQAQEVFVHKAMRDKMKNEIIAKLSNETSILYNDVMRNIQNLNLQVKLEWDKETFATITGKQAMFQGIAEFHQGLECKTKKLIGEHITRLKTAKEYLKNAIKYSKKLTKANEVITLADQMLKEAIRENDCIFHDVVPDKNSIHPIGRAALVKAQPVPQFFSKDFRDLFEELVPVAVQNLLILFESRKREIVQSEVCTLREATQLLNGVLASLNLPAAIEDSLEQEIPRSLVTKSTSVQNHGGLTTINRMLERLPDLYHRNKELLEDIEKLLIDEEESDDNLRRKFKEKWTRKNSSRLTSSFKANLEKYRRTIGIANQADKLLRDKFEEHKMYIEILCNGPEAVANATPQAALKYLNKDSESVNRLKQLMDQVEAIKISRDAIESELNSSKDDMKEIFLSSINKENLCEEALLENELTRIFNPTRQKIKECIENQDRVLEEIRKANAEFISERKEQDDAARERERVLKKLAAAYDAFMGLSKHLKEGTKFYNDLTEVILMFQSKVSDFCFARRTEKEELLRDLEKETKSQTQATTSQDMNCNRPITYTGTMSQGVLGSYASCSASPDLPYPTFPLNMPMPYGAHFQHPYPQHYMPPPPSVYYTMPYPSGYHQTPIQNPPHPSNSGNQPPS